MNDNYRQLKQQYDDIGKQILGLHEEQGRIQQLMVQACTHVDLSEIIPDSYLVEMGIEDEETKFKCKDCYRYFSKEEVTKMKEQS